MTTETTPAAPAAQLLASGVLDEKCGTCCGLGGHYLSWDLGPEIPCTDCNATGYKHWRLIRKCKHDHICTECVRDTDLRAAHCRTCQGRGYRVAPDAELGMALKATLRDNGWMVAIHNDYRQDGKLMVFWLFTDSTGHYVKAEAETDDAALVAAFLEARNV